MGDAPIFYLSPHADDVAFSCGGSVALDCEAGRAVTLITAFLSGKDADTRGDEDTQAAARLGCAYQCLNLPDAKDRPEVRGALGIFMPFGPQHLGITSEVVSRLLWHITSPAELVAPLAVGGHIDHRIVHEAARALAYLLGPSVRLSFYEDQPYSLVPYSLERRLAALQPAAPVESKTRLGQRGSLSQEIAAYRTALSAWPMIQRKAYGLRLLSSHLAARFAVFAEKGGQRPGFAPRLQPIVRVLNTPLLQSRRRQAIAAYASQWPLFAASLDELCESLAAYGRRLNDSSTVGERLWIDDGVFG